MVRCYASFYRQKKLVRYITIAMSSLRKNKAILEMADYDKVNVPAMFLERLAVDNGMRGMH
jgi:hypothetical protein